MQLIEIDHVDPQPPQRSLDGALDRLGPSVAPQRHTRRLRNETRLRRHDHLAAPAFEGLSEQLLVRERAVHLGRIEQRDAEIDRTMDHRDRFVLLVGTDRLAIPPGKSHRAVSDLADGRTRLPQCPEFHVRALPH